MEKYSKENFVSYSFGIFPTFELLTNRAEYVDKLILSTKLEKTRDTDKLLELAKDKNILIETNDKAINKLSDKENCFVVGEFKKYTDKKQVSTKQLVLVNPSDMGNLGTIFRTALGFGITDICIIRPCADYFNPKVIRASMGAIFSLNIQEFDNFQDFLKQNKLDLFLFMLNGEKVLGSFDPPKDNFALVYGNEATGLPKDYTKLGNSVIIKHSDKIDSLNLPMSVGIGLFEFSKNNQ